jgi:putative Mg2+ transporter-C (MgtC) family protein
VRGVLGNDELAIRIVLAAALGAGIGFERELADQPAGLRTHILVSLGAALFTLVGTFGLTLAEHQDIVRFDPTRIAAQVVTGVGFLGAGAILQQGLNVRGLTTAASLWVTAAMGTAVGLGYYLAATMTLAVAVIALMALKPVEHVVLQRLSSVHRSLLVEAESEFRLADLRRALEDSGTAVRSVGVTDEGGGTDQYVLSVRLARGQSPRVVVDAALSVPGVIRADWHS